MALVACEECGREISNRSSACVGCGAPMPRVGVGTESLSGAIVPEVTQGDGTRSEFRPLLWMSLLLVSGLVVWLLWKIASSSQAPSQAEAEAKRNSAEQTNVLLAVQDCDKRYAQMNADRQYSPAELRAYAQVCQQIRDDYKAKWGVSP